LKPRQVTIPKAHEIIGSDGSIADENIAESVRLLGATLVASMRSAA